MLRLNVNRERALVKAGAVGRVLLVALALVLSPARSSAQDTRDSLVTRVQQLVNAGNRDGARALADSALVIRTPGTNAHAEALFARALATSDAAAAERDYARLAIEYPFSARAEDATLMVAQFRQSRGDRAGARVQYERLAMDFPGSTMSARHNYWAGRLALDDGDLAKGCRYLGVAVDRVPKDDVELRNQVNYLRVRCETAGGEAPPSPPPADTARVAPPPAPEPAPEVAPKSQTEYSVQVAAYGRKRDADAAAARLKARGFQVRVVGTKAPYRVRVGRYATRADAVAAQGRMKRQSRVNGIVVEAEPR
ncbi:MAG: SPOR domain-containing protein [Gemmatimonadetes bacterium]|nr:SPOR domain-containing protein [Gemmatimonadota bacterium]